MDKMFIFSLLFAFLPLITQPANAQPETKLAYASARFTVETAQQPDTRHLILKNYLQKYNSPLAEKSEYIVEQADIYDIDYRLLVAISGVESTYAKAYPPSSHNAWGWGGSNLIHFSSWEEAIETITRSLRVKYIDRMGSDDVYRIGAIYAASPTWGSRVEANMLSIEESKDDLEPQLAFDLSII